ncbi:MAG: hypothetical protein JSW51_04230 [Gemmatimonadota bacterium]|nr:MAG: hypothetical protein JSW51_04230 [Gemmatimonadota bacterium]
MKFSKLLHQKNTGRFVAAAVLIILVPFVYGLVRPVTTSGETDARLFLERPDEEHEECVRETTYMRFQHMELLKQTREDVIRHGIRGEITLSGCRECHTSRERFCNKCHDAASLILDCFGCHYYPEPGEENPTPEREADDG